MSLVSISIVGHVVRPPEQIIFASGKAKTTVVVAVNTRHGKSGENKDHTDFYKVEAWGPLGELAHTYISKGNQVGVVGKLVLDKWIDKNGKERLTPLIKADQISLPPRFRVVEPEVESFEPTNPVRGELELATQEMAASTSYASPELTVVDEEVANNIEFVEPGVVRERYRSRRKGGMYATR